MPKEQGHFGERVGRNTSKNAKDKSNSATLLASQGDRHWGQTGAGNICGMGERLSHFDSEKDSEKDSGYSEAGSDSVQNDLEDCRSSVSQPHRKSSRSVVIGNPAGCNAPQYEELTPVYVIRNLAKPSRPEQILHRPVAWAGGWHSLADPKAPTQLLLIQQPGIPSSSTPIPTPKPADTQSQTKKGSGRTSKNHHSCKNAYLPILNSYPRIAPHPRKDNHAQGRASASVGGVKESGGEGQSQSKRVCTEEEKKRETVSTTSNLSTPQQQQQHHGRQREGRGLSHSQHKVRRGPESLTNLPHCSSLGHRPSSTSQTKSNHHSHQSLRSDSVASPSVSSSQMPSPPSRSSSDPPSSSSSSPSSSVAHSPYHQSGREGAATLGGHLSDSWSECSSVRQRRFHNTAEILNQSGLLAITLRIKELLKQNAAVEREIAQLHQHTQLLCQAAQASQRVSNDSSNSLGKLLQAMTQSGSYPSLHSTQVKALSHNLKKGEDKGEEKEIDKLERTENAQHQHLVSLCGLDDGALPPSPLFAPSPEAEGMEQTNGLAGLLSHSLCAPLLFEQTHSQEGIGKDSTLSPEELYF